jgi:hypothetical protein
MRAFAMIRSLIIIFTRPRGVSAWTPFRVQSHGRPIPELQIQNQRHANPKWPIKEIN